MLDFQERSGVYNPAIEEILSQPVLSIQFLDENEDELIFLWVNYLALMEITFPLQNSNRHRLGNSREILRLAGHSLPRVESRRLRHFGTQFATGAFCLWEILIIVFIVSPKILKLFILLIYRKLEYSDFHSPRPSTGISSAKGRTIRLDFEAEEEVPEEVSPLFFFFEEASSLNFRIRNLEFIIFQWFRTLVI